MKILIALFCLALSPLATAGGAIGAESIKKLLPRTTAIFKAKITKSRIIGIFDDNGTYVGPNFDEVKVISTYTVIHCADLEISEVLYGGAIDPFNNTKTISITWTDLAINHKGRIQNSDCPHVSEKAQSKVSRIWTLIKKNRRWHVLADSDPKITKELKGIIKEYEKKNPIKAEKGLFE